jgi:hypothetical protein
MLTQLCKAVVLPLTPESGAVKKTAAHLCSGLVTWETWQIPFYITQVGDRPSILLYPAQVFFDIFETALVPSKLLTWLGSNKFLAGVHYWQHVELFKEYFSQVGSAGRDSVQHQHNGLWLDAPVFFCVLMSKVATGPRFANPDPTSKAASDKALAEQLWSGAVIRRLMSSPVEDAIAELRPFSPFRPPDAFGYGTAMHIYETMASTYFPCEKLCQQLDELAGRPTRSSPSQPRPPPRTFSVPPPAWQAAASEEVAAQTKNMNSEPPSVWKRKAYDYKREKPIYSLAADATSPALVFVTLQQLDNLVELSCKRNTCRTCNTRMCMVFERVNQLSASARWKCACAAGKPAGPVAWTSVPDPRRFLLEWHSVVQLVTPDNKSAGRVLHKLGAAPHGIKWPPPELHAALAAEAEGMRVASVALALDVC